MKYSFLLLFLLIAGNAIAQNLVPNPSFEDTVHCPILYGYVTQCTFWISPTNGDGVYYNSCASPLGFFAPYGVPWNQYAYQYAEDSNAYVMVSTISFGGVENERHYIETPLLETLEANKKYRVQFYVSLGDSSAWGCDNIGAYFSDTMIHDYSTQSVLNYSPQIENSLSNSLNDKSNWVLIVDSFIAQGGEKFMTIGNFRDSINSIFYPVKGGAPWSSGSYILVDNVSIVPLSEVGIENMELPSSIKVSPNPVRNELQVLFVNFNANYSITIQDCAGRKLIYIPKVKVNRFDIDTSSLPSGIYLIRINDQSGYCTKKIIKN